MSDESPRGSRPRTEDRLKTVVLTVGLIIWLLFLIPPFSTWTREYEFVQATQFCVFAMVTPCLIVIGRPWRRLGLASGTSVLGSENAVNGETGHFRLVDRVVIARRSRHGDRRGVTLLLVFMAQAIVWRSSPVVSALIRHPWLSVLESVMLVLGGVVLWIELVESAPLSPTTTRPYRIGISTIAMWTIWVLAYLLAMAHNSWYAPLHDGIVRVISTSADQQLTAACMWFITAGVFLPLVFSNLTRWLQAEENPDDELYHLVRQEKTRGFFGTNP